MLTRSPRFDDVIVRPFVGTCYQADEFGILLYTDMQFTWGSVRGTKQESEELAYQLKRLSHHPAVAMWDGCNECGGGGLYESFVMPTVAKHDTSRPIWPSCPAPGWTSGVDTLSSRPNGDVLKVGAGGAPAPIPRLAPGGFPFPQESHGPYTAFMKGGVEGIVMPKAQPIPNPNPPNWNVNDPTAIPALTGPGYEGWYKSEFGCVSWSSFESMSADMPQDQWYGMRL